MLLDDFSAGAYHVARRVFMQVRTTVLSKMDTVAQSSASPLRMHSEIVAAAVVAIVTLLSIFWFSRRRASQRLPLPPGPKGWPVLGSLPSLGTLPHRSLQNLSRKYGPIMFMHLGNVPTLVVSNASMAKEILKTNDQIMSSRPYQIVTHYLTYNQQDVGFSPAGPQWRQARKICTMQLLTTSRISQFQGTIEREIRFMVESILGRTEKGDALRMSQFLGDATMNIISQMMWNKRYRGIKGESSPSDRTRDEFNQLIRELFMLAGVTNIADYLPVPAAFKSLLTTIQGLDKQMRVLHEKLDAFIDNVIREHQEKGKYMDGGEQAPSDADDFVDVFLKLSRSGEFEGLSPDMMKGILLDMLTAGTDSSAVTLEWSLSEVLKHPAVLTRLQDELDLVVGPDRLVITEDIPNLKYLQAVIKEALRLHPPGPLLVPHESVEDCVVANYHIPAKSLVFVNIFAIHRDPAVYERPDEFNPDRFLNSATDFRGQNFELIPFGSGRRMCPATNLAANNLHLALGQLLHAFTWTLPDNQKPEEIDMTEAFGLVVQRTTPLRVLAKPRLKHDVYYPKSASASPGPR